MGLLQQQSTVSNLLRQWPHIALCTRQGRTNGKSICRDVDRQDSPKRTHQTGNGIKSKLKCSRTKERLLTLVPRRLTQNKRCDNPRIVSAPQHWWIYRFTRWRPYLPNLKYQVRILASRNRPKMSREDSLHKPPWPISMFSNAFWAKQRY